MSASSMNEQTAPEKHFLASKFTEHIHDDNVPGYGQDTEVMRRLYGSHVSEQPIVNAGAQSRPQACSDKLTEDHMSVSLSTDTTSSQPGQHAKVEIRDQSKVLSIRSAFSRMKTTFKTKGQANAGLGTDQSRE